MINQKDERPNDALGSGSRAFAAAMGSVWVVAGLYGIYRGVSTDPRYLFALSVFAIIYGALWLNTARTGRWGRIPLWP